ncbi:hypothetical protein A33Q_1439 [Indibacter alkaliphilus LW1]|uniref:Uncharacterized protein n=1 Tax=Indibacter alkaliphilus (strain CCUG 57479 / KCTC 22604 / LW1) TaxID=1189612 RepID=S2DNI1_INDAL|nr:hypothetical protein A33Q_1439 [Indibacter alkaliphilus LW1]
MIFDFITYSFEKNINLHPQPLFLARTHNHHLPALGQKLKSIISKT